MKNGCKLAVACLIGLTACDLGTDPAPRTNYGLLLFSGRAREDGTFATRPTGFFFRSAVRDLPDSREAADQCVVRDYSPPTPGSPPPDFVNAGDAISFAVSGVEVPMTPVAQGASQVYIPADSVVFTPGDLALFAIPGAAGGFPASSIQVVTATPFAFGTVEPAPTIGQGLDLTWSPAGDDSSKMVVSLQYASPAGQVSTLNEQILCDLVDDGAFTVDPLLVSGWREALDDERRLQASRWRTASRDLGDAQLFTQSTFDYEKTEFP
jgi:hypothetical protein